MRTSWYHISLHGSERNRGLSPLIKGSGSTQSIHDHLLLGLEFQRRRCGGEVELTCVTIVFVFTLDHAAQAAHPGRVFDEVHFFDTLRLSLRDHFLELLALVHDKLWLMKLLDTLVVRVARDTTRVQHIIVPHLMNSVPFVSVLMCFSDWRRKSSLVWIQIEVSLRHDRPTLLSIQVRCLLHELFVANYTTETLSAGH